MTYKIKTHTVWNLVQLYMFENNNTALHTFVEKLSLCLCSVREQLTG